MMNTPIAYLLTLPYRLALAVRNRRLRGIDPVAPGPFTICVGNLTAGGAGKTPFVLHLATILKQKRKVVVLSRGYGRKTKDLVVLDGSRPVDPRECGDEPALIFNKLDGEVPVLVHRDRVRTATIAKEKYDCDVAILDDGFQGRRVLSHISVLLFDHRDLIKGERLPPLGLWREPLGGARRADILVVNFKDREPVDIELPDFLTDKPVHRMRYRLNGFVTHRGDRIPFEELAGKNVVGFSGIADPRSFRRALVRSGLRVMGFKRFLDHHWYSEGDLARIERLRVDSNAELLVTTEKDLARVEDPPEALLALSIEVNLEDESGVLGTIEDALALHGGEAQNPQGQEHHVG
jgi:tetraacyldisaccharide 4'-kinase